MPGVFGQSRMGEQDIIWILLIVMTPSLEDQPARDAVDKRIVQTHVQCATAEDSLAGGRVHSY